MAPRRTLPSIIVGSYGESRNCGIAARKILCRSVRRPFLKRSSAVVAGFPISRVATFPFIDDRVSRANGGGCLGSRQDGGSTFRASRRLIVIRSLHRSDGRCQMAEAICQEVFITQRARLFRAWGKKTAAGNARGCGRDVARKSLLQRNAGRNLIILTEKGFSSASCAIACGGSGNRWSFGEFASGVMTFGGGDTLVAGGGLGPLGKLNGRLDAC